MVIILGFAGWAEDASLSNPGVFIDDGILNAGAAAHAESWDTRRVISRKSCIRIIVIRSHHHHATQRAAGLQYAPHADDTMLDAGLADDATIGNDRMVNRAAIDF